MLEELMRECRNWFKVPDGAYSGTFTIKDGSITLPFLVEGQYFRIIGSVFNDGVYQYGAGSLTDETFDGAVWALAVPADFISLVEDVEAWRNKYENAANSPFQSESFAGYSYTLKSDSAAQGGSSKGWRGAFSTRLNKWRKL